MTPQLSIMMRDHSPFCSIHLDDQGCNCGVRSNKPKPKDYPPSNPEE